MARIVARRVRAKTQTKYEKAIDEAKNDVAMFERFKQEAAGHGIRQVNDIKAAGNVSCRGHKKPIYLINNSFVMLPGHNTERELAVSDLGGRMCRCLEALKELKACRLSGLPRLFHDAVIAASQKRQKRSLLHRYRRPRHLVETVAPGATGIMQRKARLLLRLKTMYKTARDARCYISVYNSIGFSRAYGGIYHNRSSNLPTVEINLSLTPTWRTVIQPQGLAVIDGRFVLDIGYTKVVGGDRYCRAAGGEARRLIKKARNSKGVVAVWVVDEYPYEHYKKTRREREFFISTRIMHLDFSGLKPRLIDI